MGLENGGAAVDRRSVLQIAGGVGSAGLAGLAGCQGGGSRAENTPEHPPLGNYPIDGDAATLGFNVPQSGPYASEGEDELRAYQLAVKHLNEGGGWVDSQFDDLSGDGVLGYTIDHVDGDTATDADQARQSASGMIQRDDAIMISGGSSSAVAIAVQGLCQNEKVMFMCCLTHSNDTTGKDCVRYSFREMFNAYMTGQALAPVVRDAYGRGLQFYQLYADYSWGQRWSRRSVISSPRVAGSNSRASRRASGRRPRGPLDGPGRRAEVVFLDDYGLDAANSLTTAQEILPDEVGIVVPLYNRIVAPNASTALGGVVGTVAWDTIVSSDLSNAFKNAVAAEHGNASDLRRGPSGLRTDAPVRRGRRAGRYVLSAGGYPRARRPGILGRAGQPDDAAL